jgi:four helix bundle protein
MYDHKSLEAWREARSVSLAVLGIAQKHWKPWAAALVSQLQRASLSVQLNIAEGWTYNRSPTYRRHLGIAFGSAVETAECSTSQLPLVSYLPPKGTRFWSGHNAVRNS